MLTLAFLLAAFPLPAAPPSGRAFIDSYISEVDGSRQEYGVYTPASPRPADGYPVVLHFHGYGWSVSASFSDSQKQWAEDHGWLLVNVNGRGPTFYDGIGENDVFGVLRDLDAKYGMDETRIYATGSSMGGTGAYRMGVRHPDVFAAVVGVDGWTDYRLWHWHWYARADDRTSVEPFRKRLLEAASPLATAESAATGNVGLITDTADTVVDPPEGIQLQQKLDSLGGLYPGEYGHSGETPPGGHGAGYDLRKIYRYFLGKSVLRRPVRVRHACTQLKYGSQHWVSVERMLTQGARATIEADGREGRVTVKTSNVAAFSLRLLESAVADEKQVRVTVDGFDAHIGPPGTVNLYALLAPDGKPAGWTTEDPFPSLRKTPVLEGPIGDAFTKPFVLVYGTTGGEDATAQNLSEARQFAADWNGMFVHYDAVAPIPDTAVTARDVERKSLVLFGSAGTNLWIDRILAAAAIPVEVRDRRIVVHDPDHGDRAYVGGKFGCFMVYPNPLSGSRTYFVISHGSYALKPDGTALRGLGFDLEKLTWGWPDYVIFNSDQADLPYVENVNNKPNSVCYEAAYFVEAGFFDQDWRLDRSGELCRIRAMPQENSWTIHVADVSIQAEPGPLGTAARVAVKVVDGAADPVRSARVTGRWTGQAIGTQSAVTDDSGIATLLSKATGVRSGNISFEVLSVMASDAEYDWRADGDRGAAVAFGGATGLRVSIADMPAGLRTGALAQIDVRVDNAGATPLRARVGAAADAGSVFPELQEIVLQPGGAQYVSYWWDTSGAAPGPHIVRVTAVPAHGDSDATDDTAAATVNLLTGD